MIAPTNFHQLHIFHTVSRLGSFSKAADELSISQPAVSIQVKELEKSLGCSLLHRMRRGLQLTDTGQAVYNYTQRIFSLAEEMRSEIQDIQGLKTGRLTIGSSTTPGDYILPWVIGQFRKIYPGIDVSLSITNTKSIIQRVLDHEFDLGMAGAPVNIQGLNSFHYVQDEIVIIAVPSNPLASQTKIALDDLREQQFILREPGSATRETAEECFREHNLPLNIVMELGSNEAVKRAVAAGLGLGIVSKFAVVPDAMAGFVKVLKVEGWHCERPLTVFYRNDEHLPAAQHAFVKFLREEKPLPEIPARI